MSLRQVCQRPVGGTPRTITLRKRDVTKLTDDKTGEG